MTTFVGGKLLNEILCTPSVRASVSFALVPLRGSERERERERDKKSVEMFTAVIKWGFMGPIYRASTTFI